MTSLAAADIHAIKAIVRQRRAQGWTVQVYGERGYHQHVYREPYVSAAFGSKVIVESGRIEYRRRGDDILPARTFVLPRPESVDEVLGWLMLLGLWTPTQEQVAAAVLQPDLEMTTR